MTYIALVAWMFVSALLCFGRYVNFEKNKNQYLVLIGIACILVMGLRNYTVGMDTRTYMHNYEVVSNARFSEILSGWTYCYMEVGYCLLMKLSSLFVDNYYFFQFITAAIYITLMFRFIRDNTENYFAASIVFLANLYLLAFNITRQMLAVSIAINAWTEINKKKNVTASVLLCIATTFHTSALIFLAAFFVYWIRNKKVFLMLIPVILIIVGVNYEEIIRFAQVHITKYAYYYSNPSGGQTVGMGRILWVLIVLISLVLIYGKTGESNSNCKNLTLPISNADDENLTELDESTAKGRVYGIFSLCYVVTQVISLYVRYFDRIGIYFEPFLIPLFEVFGNKFTNIMIRRMYYFLYCICYIMYFFVFCGIGDPESQYSYMLFL